MTQSTGYKIPEHLVDKAFEAIGGPTNTEPMTWVRMQHALAEVHADIVIAQPVCDVHAVKNAIERVRRVAESSTDDIAKKQILLLIQDALEALAH